MREWQFCVLLVLLVGVLMFMLGRSTGVLEITLLSRPVVKLVVLSLILGAVMGTYVATFPQFALFVLLVSPFTVLIAFGVGDGNFLRLWLHLTVTLVYEIGIVVALVGVGLYLSKNKRFYDP